MIKILLNLYHWFENHIKIYWLILVTVFAASVLGAAQISLDENITDFFNSGDEKNRAVFDNIKAKDKIIVMVSGDDPDAMIEAADAFVGELRPLYDEELIESITAGVDDGAVGKCTSFIYEYLPIFLEEGDYDRLEQGIGGIGERVKTIYSLVTSPSGMVIGDVLMKDPLNIGTPVLQQFEKLNPSLEYEIYSDRLFTNDMATMLMFIEPSQGMGNTGANDRLVSALEEAESLAETEGVSIDCIGGPIVAVYNARQIKRDTALTLSLAMAFILLVIFMSFRNRRSVPLIILPPLFGAVFSMAVVWLIQGSVSAIALGAGTVVLGIALSYSIHVIAHLNHASSTEEVISDLAMPLTIGSLTTIGAFASLIFTSSPLLRDMGLFSVFALIGTTVFCLVFLPHFIRNFRKTEPGRLLRAIEKWNGYSYEKNKYVLMLIAVLFVVSLFFYRDVEFNDDMSNINYMPEHIVEAEEYSRGFLEGSNSAIFIVTGADDLSELTRSYAGLEEALAELADERKIEDYATISNFVISPQEQAERIGRWNEFWEVHGNQVLAELEAEAVRTGFRSGAFRGFEEILNKEYKPCTYSSDEAGDIPGISEWLNTDGDLLTMMTSIHVPEENKEHVYAELSSLDNVSVIDRGYFSSRMVQDTSDDFNYILLISSVIVFLALLISYGRFELALLAFLPMCVSWVMILGMMALLGIKFNIINIILATFIFGIGDDFSIFIMDGLLQEYRDGRKILSAHKSAIFFSAFTILVSMGVLIFAQHPALKSIAVISVLGIAIVVLVSYTVQPFLFKLLVTSPTKKGGCPYTILTILNTLYSFVYFLLGCIVAQIWMLILFILPIRKKAKKTSFHYLVYGITRFFLNTMITVRTRRVNPHGETYDRPAVIIANHQSFIDILVMLSTTPKLIMVTKDWVWNSPFFGWIVRYADFYNVSDGYEVFAERVKDRVAEGYSIAIFPEGTRSADCSVQRFHKGAFYLAEKLEMDILPMVLYGTGQMSSKRQGFYIKTGWVVAKTMERVRYGDASFGATYQEQTKNFRKYFIEQYRAANDEYGRTSNPYFFFSLMKNYVYKGPVLEWYVRIKTRIDGKYDFWDRLIARDAVITDVGCGYGQMDFMLGLLAPERRIYGIDYDKDKMDLARNCFLCKSNVSFECGDMRTMEFRQSDVFLFNDSLHYIDWESQKAVLRKALDKLNDNGAIIVRDGDASAGEDHKKIVKTEVWSTRILKFNRTSQELSFATAAGMREFAEENGLKIKTVRCDKDSSETLFYFTKP